MSTREDMSGACEFEEELPLLLYRGELDPLERARLREHVALCARCEDAFAELEAAAEALDAAPLVHPSPERWAGLKESVLRSLGDAPAVAPCVSFQEDLLALIQHSPKANAVVDEVDAPRREAIVAHLQDCKSCKEAMGAYSAVATALSSEPIEWPTAERWDALKPAILAAVAAPVQANAVVAAPAVARSGSSAELSPARVGLARRRALPTLARIAAAVLILAGGSFLVETMRGLSPDEIRNLKREADTTTDIERAKRDYELVERAGARKPALAAEVEDARAQLVALTRCERALSQKDGDARRVELLNVISQFPDSHATEIALTKYREELGLDAAPPVVRPRKPIDPPLPVAQDVVLVINDELKHELRKAQSLPDLERKQREREVNSMFAAVFLRKGLSTTDRVLAKAELGRVLDLADPTSPAAFEARKRLEALKASEGN